MPDLQPVFDELRRRLSVHEDVFHSSHNLTDANAPGSRKVEDPSPDTYVLLGAPTDAYPDGQMFGAVKLGKRYVSYYLMSLYLFQESGGQTSAAPVMSAELAKRRQGKSCFNFSKVDDGLFDELADLTAAGRALYEEQGLLRR